MQNPRPIQPTRRAILVGGLAAPFIVTRALGGTVQEAQVLQSRVLGHPVTYSLYLPPNYRHDNRRYPVLYLLHGGGDGQPADWFRMAGVDVLLDGMIAERRMPAYIAVAPDGRRPADDPRATYFLDDADGSYRWRTMFLEEFVPGIEARHQIIGSWQMRALLGLSMGGHAALLNQLVRPDLFAGAAALSAALRTPQQVAAMDQAAFDLRFSGAFGDGLEGQARLNEPWRTNDPTEILSRINTAPFLHIPRLYLDLAAQDPFFEGNAAAHVALDRAGIQHRFQVHEGGHDWIFWRAALPRALDHISRIYTRSYGE